MILIRIISPFFLVKMVFLDFSRIGAIYPVFWYLKLKKLKLLAEITSKRSIYLFFFSDNILTHINIQWLSMWKRSLKNLNILPFAAIFKTANTINRFFPGYKNTNFLMMHLFIHINLEKGKHLLIPLKKALLTISLKVNNRLFYLKMRKLKLVKTIWKKLEHQITILYVFIQGIQLTIINTIKVKIGVGVIQILGTPILIIIFPRCKKCQQKTLCVLEWVLQ